MYQYVLGAGCALLLAGCGGGGSSASADSGSDSTSRSVSIEFEAMAAGVPVACDTNFDNLGSANTSVQFRDFRVYLHDIRLVSEGGEEYPVTLDQNDWQHQDLALLDFENQAGDCSSGTVETNHLITGSVSDDSVTFTGIRFGVGVPEDLNHADQSAAASPLNINGLQLSWQSGYKFVRIDVNSGSVASWNVHLGSTGCTGNPSTGTNVSCGAENRPEVELSDFDPDADVIRLDYAQLIFNNDLSVDTSEQPGCMSNPNDAECNEVFSALGININTGAPQSGQAFFSVAP